MTERVEKERAQAIASPLAARERLLKYDLPPLVLPGATEPPNPTEEVHMSLDRLTVAIFQAETALKLLEQKLTPGSIAQSGACLPRLATAEQRKR